MVSDLLMGEALTDKKPKQKSLTKSEDSGHDSGQSSLNTGELQHLISIIILSIFQVVSHFLKVLAKSESVLKMAS